MMARYAALLYYPGHLASSHAVVERLPVDRRAKESLLVVNGVFGDVVIRWQKDRCTSDTAYTGLEFLKFGPGVKMFE